MAFHIPFGNYYRSVARFVTRKFPWDVPEGSVRWLFVASFPNGGSTAFGKILASASKSIQLEVSGEGQWIVPELKASRKRWDPATVMPYKKIRSIWLAQVRLSRKLPCLVIEKSPPNMVRMRDIMATFGDMPMNLVLFCRDPYAVCSSWSSRYGPEEMAWDWGEQTAGMDPEGDDYFREMGRAYGRRARMLLDLKDIAATIVSYEELTADAQAVVERLKAIEPMLEDANADTKVAVKDYAPQPLQNMNDRQIGKLTPAQISAISEGLREFEAEISELGYAIR